MIVTVAIMSIVLGAIGTAIVTTIGNQQTTSNRVADSSSAQITSAVYVRDVESALQVTTDMTASSPALCGTGTTLLLGLWWQTGSSQTVVSYWANPAPPPSTIVLVSRKLCVNSATPISTVQAGTGLSGVRVDVTPAANAAAANNGWTGVTGISAITMDAIESASTFPFDLLATPRLATEQTGGNPAPPPLFLLGQTNPVLSCNGNGMLAVVGNIFIDSPSNNAGQLSGHPSVSATNIYTADSNPSMSISGPAGSYSPAPVFASPQPDPYAGLTPPSTSGLPVHNSMSYQGPGVYNQTLTLTNGTTTLATGTYILHQGISVSGNASLTTQAGGVLLYVDGGSVMFAGNGAVTLAPLQPPPYAPTAPSMLIWQAASDTNPVILSGNGSGNLFSGTIYAPKTSVGSSGNGSFTAGSVVASSMSCAGNGTETIG
jgi:hypothetical protein